MKTFRQFNEEASKSLKDLEKEFASSPEGLGQARRAQVKAAEDEADRRLERSDRFTQERQKEAQSTKRTLQTKAAQQKQEAEQHRAELEQQTQKREKDTAQLAARLKQTARGASHLVKSGARKLGRLIGRQ